MLAGVMALVSSVNLLASYASVGRTPLAAELGAAERLLTVMMTVIFCEVEPEMKGTSWGARIAALMVRLAALLMASELPLKLAELVTVRPLFWSRPIVWIEKNMVPAALGVKSKLKLTRPLALIMALTGRRLLMLPAGAPLRAFTTSAVRL